MSFHYDATAPFNIVWNGGGPTNGGVYYFGFVPGAPSGIAVDGEGLLWAAIPGAEQLVAVGGTEVEEVIELPAGSGRGPIALGWAAGELYAACAGPGMLIVAR